MTTPSPAPTPRDRDGRAGQRTGPGGRAWLAPSILAAALLALFAGVAQYGVTAVAADVAAEFGEPQPAAGDDPLAQVGLAMTTLGIGFGIIRLASIGSLPVAGLADRYGRRRTLLVCAAAGLTLTVLAAGAWAFWVFVALVALARPLLSGTDAIAGVIAAEEVDSRDRTKAIALIGAAYSLGSGLISVSRGLLDAYLTFRGVLLLVLVPVLALPLIGRYVSEPPRFRTHASMHMRRRLGSMPRPLWGRLALLCVITLGIGVVTGPVWTYLFVYGEGVLNASPLQMAALVVGAAPGGLAGLLLGRWTADRFGRRSVAGASLSLTALAGAAAYSDGFGLLGVGYLGSIAAAAAYAPSGGALDAEVFPTSVRATAAGWLAACGVAGTVTGLVAFGVIAEVTGDFTDAGLYVCLPVTLLGGLYVLLPETRGLELEESAPELD